MDNGIGPVNDLSKSASAAIAKIKIDNSLY